MRLEAGPTTDVPRDPGPAATVRAAALGAGLLIAQQVAAKVVRDAFYLSQFPVTTLPLALGASACLSFVAVATLSRTMARRPPARLLPPLLWGSAGLLVGEWGLSFVAPRAAAALLYLHVATFGATLVSAYWSLLNERFDPHAARRAMGTIGTGASLGGVLGGAVTWRLAGLVRVPTLLLGLAALLALCALAIRGLGGTGAGAEPPPPAARGELRWRLFAQIPYLRSLAALIALCAFIEALLDYAFNAAAVARFAHGEALVGFFAAFHTASGLLALLVQAALVRSSLTRLGLAGTLATHPLGVALLAGAVAAAPRMGMIVALRAAEAVLRHSTFRSAYELLYTPLPPSQKRPAKPLVDVGADRVGTLAGSAATLLVLAVMGRHATQGLAVLAGAAAVVMLAIALRFHRAYVIALVDSLRAGAVRLEEAEVLDATTRQTMETYSRAEPSASPMTAAAAASLAPPGATEELDATLRRAADLRSGDIVRVRAALSQGLVEPGLVAAALPLLRRDDLFGDVIPALRHAAPACTGQLLDALLDERVDPVIRRRIPRVLASVPTQRAADGLLAGLESERLDLRYRCAQALVRFRQRAAVSIPAGRVFAVARREIEGMGAGGGSRLEHVFAILSLALEREPIEIALRALRGRDPTLRGTALEYLDHVLPPAIREALWPRLGLTAAPPARRPVDDVRDELLRSSSRWTTGERRLRSSAGH
jgi:ATP:ADP antiporter, AAA family